MSDAKSCCMQGSVPLLRKPHGHCKQRGTTSGSRAFHQRVCRRTLQSRLTLTQGTAGEREKTQRPDYITAGPCVQRVVRSCSRSTHQGNMVSLTSLLAVAPVLANIATALPYLQARAGTNILAPLRVGVYMCVDADWQGHCEHLLNPPGVCGMFLLLTTVML